MHRVNMHEAKTNLSKLVEEAIAGEEVIIAKAGTPLVMLVPVSRGSGLRSFGRLKGQIEMSDDFEETPDEVVREFEGGD